MQRGPLSGHLRFATPCRKRLHAALLMPVSRGSMPKFDHLGANATSQQTQPLEHGARADSGLQDLIRKNCRTETCARVSLRRAPNGERSPMRCSRCQMENRDGRRFCASCGAALARACDCGYVNDATDRFCGGCGRPLEREAEAAADQAVETDGDRRPVASSGTPDCRRSLTPRRSGRCSSSSLA